MHVLERNYTEGDDPCGEEARDASNSLGPAALVAGGRARIGRSATRGLGGRSAGGCPVEVAVVRVAALELHVLEAALGLVGVFDLGVGAVADRGQPKNESSLP